MAEHHRPNIVVILTDQQTGSAMSCAGNPYLNTPAMDELAERGTRFSNAYCTFPLCTPSRASLWTGLMPHQHGAVSVSGEFEKMRPACIQHSLGTAFSRAGYRCVYGGKWHAGNGGSECSIDEKRHFGFEKICGFNDPQLPLQCETFLRDSDRNDPFLLVASFDNPHNICEWAHGESLPWGNLPDPPAERDCPPLPANFPREPYQPLAVRKWYGQLQGYDFDVDLSAGDWRRYRWAYFRLIERVDSLMSQILRAITEHGCAENTLIVFTSDHGEQAGSHGLQQKHVLYEESLHVPFIVAGPGVNAGITQDLPVSNGLDLLPTLAEFAGVHLSNSEDLPGVSLLELCKGGPAPSRAAIPFEVCPVPGPSGQMTAGARGIRSDRYKYVIHHKGSEPEQLFDLEADPGEMVNLATCSHHHEVLLNHRELLRKWMIRTEDQFRSGHYGFSDKGLPPMISGDEYPQKPC